MISGSARDEMPSAHSVAYRRDLINGTTLLHCEELAHKFRQCFAVSAAN